MYYLFHGIKIIFSFLQERMGDFHMLGEGSFAVVLGPIPSNSTLRLLGIKVNAKPPYIIKVYKKPFRGISQKIVEKQSLYSRLEKQSRNNSVLFPLATIIIPGMDIVQIFPIMNKYLQKDENYQIEIERYGLNMEKIILHQNKPVFNMRGFLKIWRCIPDILEDCYHILFDNNLILTDIKSENMVLSPNKTLRLIDVDINPNITTTSSRIITPSIMDLPPQYFSNDWWGPSYQIAKKNMIQVHRSDYESVYKHSKKVVKTMFDFIHKKKDPYHFANHQKLTPQENKFQRIFFVAYPLFVMILTMIISHCVDIRTEEEEARVKRIVVFCLEFLQKRGHFSSRINYKTFQHFLWKIKSL